MDEWFMSKVQLDESGCWLWIGYLDRCGYGRYSTGFNGDVLAHRISYRLHVGEIPDGLEIDHRCRVRHCVNPTHLEAVTHLTNVRRGISGLVNGGRQRNKTHCPGGHSYAGENLYVSPRGDRQCRICRSEATQRRQTRLSPR